MEPTRVNHDTTEAVLRTVSVGMLMRPDVTCVTPDIGIDSLRDLLLEKELHGIPVVDDSCNVVGIVSKSDILLHEREDAWSSPDEPSDSDDSELESFGLSELHVSRPVVVADIMSPSVVTVSELAPVSLAAGLMASEHILQLPVVSQTHELVGMIHALDVLAWLAQQGELPSSEHPFGRTLLYGISSLTRLYGR